MVTLDTEFCEGESHHGSQKVANQWEEVASTYSPNNPMAGDDLGAAAARRQGQLADNLYPFKLVGQRFPVGAELINRSMMTVPSDWAVTVLVREVSSIRYPDLG
jgi:hypothetical protein